MIVIMLCLSLSSYLVQIDEGLIGQEDIEILSTGDCFAVGRIDKELATKFQPDLQILCDYNSSKIYLWVHRLPGSRLEEIEKAGRILLIKDDDLLLETDETLIKKLSTRYLMISRLPKHPIKIKSKRPKKRTFFYDPLVQAMVDSVDSNSVLNYVQTLQDFISRNSFNDGCDSAVAYTKRHFETLGYDSVQYHYYSGSYAPNIWAVKCGEYDDSTYVICGHIDATIGSPHSNEPIAPGADDNGSGSACVMEAARVMAGYDFEHRVVFICFTGEEQGLVGSEYWCQQHQNDPMYGALNFDMIGYMDRPDRLRVISDYQSVWLMDFVDSCAAYYVPGLEVTTLVDPGSRYSDHARFWDIGVAALCHIERPNGWNPYYHTMGDTIGAGFNDLTFCWQNTKVGVASLASLAEPIGPGVAEENLEQVTSRIFPTIVCGSIHIPTGIEFKIHDATGRIFAQGDGGKVDLPAGIYFVRITGDQQSLEKIVVLE